MGKRLKRLGALAQAVYAGNEKEIVVGHTLVQKLFYFLQHGKDVDLGYRYRLYHYGPYCQEVWGDISYLEDINAVKVTANPNKFGYHIFPETEIQEVIQFANSDIKAKVDELLDILGYRPVRDLECLATTHYVYKELLDTGKDPATLREAVKDGVLALKPHLGEDEVWIAKLCRRRVCSKIQREKSFFMDKERLYNWSLEQKEAESIRIIKETIERFGPDKVATTFTGGKDSTVLLHLIKQACGGQVPMRVMRNADPYEHGAGACTLLAFSSASTRLRWGRCLSKWELKFVCSQPLQSGRRNVAAVRRKSGRSLAAGVRHRSCHSVTPGFFGFLWVREGQT